MSQLSIDPAVSKMPIPANAENLATVCVLCSHNCGLRVDVEDNRITKIRADESSPITKGYICNKGFSVGHYVNHAQRVQHPLKRQPDGSFERVSWDDAIADIAARMVKIRDENGPRAIGLVGIGGQANHMDGPFALSWLGAVGSKKWFNAFAQEKTQHFLVGHWMFDATPSSWFHPDVANAKFLLVIGTNPKISNRGQNATDAFKALTDDPERRYVVVDPRETETTRGADGHLKVKAGTDAHLLLGIAASIAGTEGLANATFIKERTRDFDRLAKALSSVDVGEMARRCGLTKEQITDTARELATAESSSIMWDLAVEHAPFSTLISYLIHAIQSLTGSVGSHGGNHFIETANVPELSPKRFEEPERALASGIQSVAAIGGFPMFSPTLVPEEVMVDHPERLRALFVEGSNPILSFSDAARWREARERLDLLVVVDPAMTETARLADYVLPTPVGYEKWEVAGFPKGFPEIYVQLRPPVVTGPEDALPEPEIYTRLFEAMNLAPAPPEELFALAEHALEPEGAAAYFGALSTAAAGDQAKIMFWGYRTLGPQLAAPSLVSIWAQTLQNAVGRRESVLRTLGDAWADKNPFEIGLELFRRIMDHPEGVEIARAAPIERNLDENIGFEDGKIRLAPEPMMAEIQRAIDTPPVVDPEFPFTLGAGLRTGWTANTIQRDPKWRKGRGPHCALNLSPDDADKLGVSKGDSVRLVTRRGSAELPANIDKKLQSGHVWVPNGFGMSYPKDGDGPLEVNGINLNELSDATLRDPITGCPEHKATPCRIEKVVA